MTLSVPEPLMVRFRAVAMERLERIDSLWTSLVRGGSDAEAEPQLLRDVHTLKGDAKVVGLTEASILCQRLEDLLSAARAREYRVHEDVDIVVTMAIQFVTMLVRTRSVTNGLDLNGFLKQIEVVMGDWLQRSSEAPHRELTLGPHLRSTEDEQVAHAASLRLARATSDVYLEHLRLRGEARLRLRRTWEELVASARDAQRTFFAPVLGAHVQKSADRARNLGKAVDFVVGQKELAMGPETTEALRVVLLHGLRNAVEHGIEIPAIRQRHGKAPVGTIKISLRREEDVIQLTIEDDGSGVDVERLRQRAVERGLLSPGVASHASLRQLVDCLFGPGSTDRCIGLDAANAAVAKLGGRLDLFVNEAQRTCLRVYVFDARGAMNVIPFKSACSDLTFAVAASYDLRPVSSSRAIILEDALRIPREREGPPELFAICGERSPVTVATSGIGQSVRAFRWCPTRDDDLIEIVRIGEREAILIRPEVLRASAISD